MKIATKSKRRWWELSYLRWTKKSLWNSVHYEQSYNRSCWPTLSRQCTFSVCQCIWVRATWLWCWGNFTPPLPPNFAQSDLGRRADSRWALPQISRLFMFCYKFFCQREISEMRGPTGVKFCTMVSTRPYFIMPVQNFWRACPKKISGAKNMQNLTWFRTTSKFGGEYLQNGWRYLKSDSHSVYRDSSCVRRKKYGKVWSSDLGDLDVKSYLPKPHFSEDHISAPRGCYAPKFLHVLENDQVLPARFPPGTGAPLQFFLKGGQKLA